MAGEERSSPLSSAGAPGGVEEGRLPVLVFGVDPRSFGEKQLHQGHVAHGCGGHGAV